MGYTPSDWPGGDPRQVAGRPPIGGGRGRTALLILAGVIILLAMFWVSGVIAERPKPAEDVGEINPPLLEGDTPDGAEVDRELP